MFRNRGLLITGLIVLMMGFFETMAMADTSPTRASAADTRPTRASAAVAIVATTSDTYVGTQKCRMCHMAQGRALTAFAADTSLTLRMNRRPGVTTDSKAQGHRGNPLSGVRTTLQCETCHGRGSRHFGLGMANRDSEARRATINLPDGNTCRSCHSPHQIRG